MSKSKLRIRQRLAASLLAIGLTTPCAAPQAATKLPFAFAVLSDTLRNPADELATQRLLNAIGRDNQVAFVVYDGNLKGAAERCADSLYLQRRQILDASARPLIFIPGAYDWADCGSARGGGYDVTERLDFLRQTFDGDDTSLGRSSLPLKRESEVARFHTYRENVRWEFGDVVFVGVNVVGDNNHYLNAGGRNGEYDDRAIATGFWLEHCAEYARRHRAKALVVFLQADPDFARYERRGHFPWLRFGPARPRDGYLEFKRSLVKAAHTFRGPLVVIHAATTSLPHGFSIDRPLFDDKGKRMTNVTRIAIALRQRDVRWARISVNAAQTPPLRVTVRQIPPPVATAATLPLPSLPTVAAPSASGVMPAPAPSPQAGPPTGAEAEPPLLPTGGGSAVPPVSAPDGDRQAGLPDGVSMQGRT